jgi:hypothetical protein
MTPEVAGVFGGWMPCYCAGALAGVLSFPPNDECSQITGFFTIATASGRFMSGLSTFVPIPDQGTPLQLLMTREITHMKALTA